MNDLQLDGGNWKNYSELNTDSLWIIPKRASDGAHKGDYHGNFVPQIPKEFLTRFTKKGGWMLDLFVGSGTSLIEAKKLGRNAIGFDVSKKAREISESRLQETVGQGGTKVRDTDSFESSSYVGLEGKFDLILAHPPYLDIVKFSDDSRCLINSINQEMESEKKVTTEKRVEAFHTRMEGLAEKAVVALKPGGHFVYVIGDIYRDGQWWMLGFESWSRMLKAGGLVSKAVVIKNMEGNEKGKGANKNLWRYRHLKNGSFDFKHEYIFVGKKVK